MPKGANIAFFTHKQPAKNGQQNKLKSYLSNVILTSLASVMTNKRYKQHKKANCFISVKVVVSFSSPDLEQLAFLFMGLYGYFIKKVF